MATNEELAAENARLRDELNAARRAPQAGAVDPGVIQAEQRATATWQHWDAQVKRLNKEAADAWSEGRFEEAQAKQSEIAAATIEPKTHRWRGPAQSDAKLTTICREQAGLALDMLLWHVHSNRNGRYTE